MNVNCVHTQKLFNTSKDIGKIVMHLTDKTDVNIYIQRIDCLI